MGVYTGYNFAPHDPVGEFGYAFPPRTWWNGMMAFFFAWLGFVMLQIALLGMLQSSLDMANPWGMDLTDICVTHSIVMAATNCKKLYNWDLYMKLQAQVGIAPNGSDIVRQVAPLVANAHDDLRTSEELQGTETDLAGLGGAGGGQGGGGGLRCKRRFKIARPMFFREDGEADLDFGEAGASIFPASELRGEKI